MSDLVLTFKEAAKLCKVSESTIRRMVRDGQLKSCGKARINRSYIESYIQFQINCFYCEKQHKESREPEEEKIARLEEEKKAMSCFYSNKRRAAKKKRLPKWADLNEIEKFYKRARKLTSIKRTQYVVDHIIPLQGKYVSGLHVENNLQVITAKENGIKNNKFDL